MRKFARLGLSFALLIIAMSTQSNEKITTGEPVTTLSNGDFSAMLERLTASIFQVLYRHIFQRP